LCKSHAADSAPDYGCVSCVMLRDVSCVMLRDVSCVMLRDVSCVMCVLRCMNNITHDTHFSKGKCSSLKMILRSKCVGAILNVLM